MGWGTILGGKFYISGVEGYNAPIWDVLALQGEQAQALNVFQRVPEVRPSQLGRWCQLGLLGLGFAPGLVGLGFSQKFFCIIVNTVYLHTICYFINVRAGENGWMA